MGKVKDLTGMRFGRWLVLSYAGLHKSKRNYHKWTCQCDCGTQREVVGNNLKKGLSTSCGCTSSEASKKRMVDLSGQQFGRLMVLSYSHSADRTYWNCLCECGNIVVIRGHDLTQAKRKSCGCYRKTHGLSKDSKKYREYLKSDPFRRLRLRVSNAVGKSLRQKNCPKGGNSTWKYLPYTSEQLKSHLESQFESWMNWDNYGGRTNDTKKTWWIDHIIPQSKFKYTSMSDKEFLDCWTLSNLRPMEKMENLKKGIKLCQQ